MTQPPLPLFDGDQTLDDVADLAHATGVSLPLTQARAYVEASSFLERNNVRIEAIQSGTTASTVRDLRCGMPMSLKAWFGHVSRHLGLHVAADVELVTEVIGRPDPALDTGDADVPVTRAVRARRTSARARRYEQLMSDPDIRARSAGIAGESYRDDD